jgi:hypothetical protein
MANGLLAQTTYSTLQSRTNNFPCLPRSREGNSLFFLFRGVLRGHLSCQADYYEII